MSNRANRSGSNRLQSAALSRRDFLARAGALGLGTTVGSTLLSACGGGGGGGESMSGTLTIWHYMPVPTQHKFIRARARAFEKAHPEVRVKYVYVPFDQIAAKVLSSTVSGDSCDVAILEPAQDGPSLADAKAIIDMAPYFRDYRDRDIISDNALTLMDDQLIAVKGYINTTALWYNKDILDKVGVKPPATVGELEQALTAATDQGFEGLAVAAEPTGTGEFVGITWFLGEGVNYDNFDSPKTADVFERIGSWAHAGYIPADAVNWTQADSFNDFLKGETAFTQGGNWELTHAEADAEFEYGVVPLPAGSAGSHAMVGGEGLVIPSNSEKQDLAWEYIQHGWLSKEGNLAALETIGSLPVRDDMANAQPLQESPVLETYAQVVETALQRPTSPKIKKAVSLFAQQWSAVIAGSTSPKKAAAALKDVPKLLKSQ